MKEAPQDQVKIFIKDFFTMLDMQDYILRIVLGEYLE
jgi:hypothetical protein